MPLYNDRGRVTIDFNLNNVLTQLEGLIEEIIVQEITQIMGTIDRWRKAGISDDAIRERLLFDLKNETGMFKTVANKLGRISMAGVNQANQASYYEKLLEGEEPASVKKKKYMWVLDPGAQHCSTCPTKNGVVKTFDEWLAAGLPGSGIDECGANCRCSLVPVD